MPKGARGANKQIFSSTQAEVWKGDNIDHPEKQDNEIFLGNFTPGGMNSLVWQTKRAGSVAYDGLGERLKGYVPVFVSKSEINTHVDDNMRQSKTKVRKKIPRVDRKMVGKSGKVKFVDPKSISPDMID